MILRTALSVSLLALLAAPAIAQTKNVKLLGRFNPSEDCNDIWGYTDPKTGKEYAILGSTQGTYFFDTSNPSSPRQTGFIPTPVGGSRNAWRDMKTVGSYCYIVSEAHGGMQIVDLSNPDAPKLVKFWDTGLYRNAHNIGVDEANGYVIPCGTNSGTHIIDVKSDPVNPKLVTTLSRPYLHDVSMQDGILHGADIYGNNYVLYDVSNLPTISQLGSVRAPGTRYFHAIWPTRDNNYAAGTNESSGGPLSIYDIRNKRSPQLIASYRPAPSSAIAHNPFVRDRVVHMSYYTEGYHALDLSNPAKPVLVGMYDTWSGGSSGYNGAWGCYSFNPSGRIFISDIQSGLYILEPACATSLYGKATPGASDTPSIHTHGSSYTGNSQFAVIVENAAANASGVAIVASQRSSIVFQGLAINVDLASPNVMLSLKTGANGDGSAGVPIPANASLAGATLHTQCFVLDAGGKFGFSGTQGLTFTVFQP